MTLPDLPYAEVIGDPIAQSKSPVIHGHWLEKQGIAGAYRAVHVLPDDLSDYVAARRSDPFWRGCNVTIPHKQAVIGCCDRLDPAAEAIGAVNTMYRGEDGMLVGTNTDKDGVLAAIAGADIAGQTVCIIGSGGAARAAFAALAQQKVKAVVIVSRTPDKAAAAASGFGFAAQGAAFADADAALCGCPLLINASPMGMAGQTKMESGVLAALLKMRKGGTVFDMVYHPLETELLAAARRADLVAADGLTMLTAQAAYAFVRFFGGLLPDASDPALRKLLTA